MPEVVYIRCGFPKNSKIELYANLKAKNTTIPEDK
jgi:hypothetical protein